MSQPPVYTFRDAGLHSRPLQVLNFVGRGLRSFGFVRPSLVPDLLLAAARKRTGLHDLGGDTVREPLEVICESIERESKLTTFGRMALNGLLVGTLANRLQIVDWANRHPEVREEKIERPWVILGLPRTGTTLLSLLFGLDPVARPLVQWESSQPIPPPALDTAAEDPRIAKAAGNFGRMRSINPPVEAMHPFGATLATECVTLLAFDLRSLSFETQGHMPSYGRWLEKTDMRSAYAIHKLTLQILQSRMPTQTWSLKTPNHLWCLDVLRETYPDARLIWTHRDPRKVVASVASLNTAMHRAMSDDTDPPAIAADWNHKLHLAVSRGLAFDRARNGDSWCAQVLYKDLMDDPIGTVKGIYAHFGDSVHPLHERRMQWWMHDRHQAAFGRHAYDLADFRLDPEALDRQYAAYMERFGIPREA